VSAAALATPPPPVPTVMRRATPRGAFMQRTRGSLQTGAYILPTLLPRVKRAIDSHHGLSTKNAAFGRPWPTCAIVRHPSSAYICVSLIGVSHCVSLASAWPRAPTEKRGLVCVCVCVCAGG
jgi:hypothetical protein